MDGKAGSENPIVDPHTSSSLLLTLYVVALSVFTESRTTRTKSRNNTSFANVKNSPYDDRRLSVIFLQKNNKLKSM